jgi:hypothetical protein
VATLVWHVAWKGEVVLSGRAVHPLIGLPLSRNSTLPVGRPEGEVVTVAAYVTC